MSSRETAGKAGTVAVRACSFTGRRHAEKKKPCQDAYASGTSREGWTVVAVADGVSGSPFSELASQAAVKAAAEFWTVFHTAFPGENAWRSALYTGMNYALQKTDQLRAEHPMPYALETTLTVVLINPGKELLYSSVGDGGVYLRTKNGNIVSLGDPMRDEDGSVYTLSSGPGHWSFGRRGLTDVEAVLVVTDGISDTIRETGKDFSLAKRFIVSAESDPEYGEICGKVLSGAEFREMDDDATVVLCMQGTEAAFQDGSLYREQNADRSGDPDSKNIKKPWDDTHTTAGKGRGSGFLDTILHKLSQAFRK